MLVTGVTDVRIAALRKHSSLKSEDSVGCVDTGLSLTRHLRCKRNLSLIIEKLCSLYCYKSSSHKQSSQFTM